MSQYMHREFYLPVGVVSRYFRTLLADLLGNSFHSKVRAFKGFILRVRKSKFAVLINENNEKQSKTTNYTCFCVN